MNLFETKQGERIKKLENELGLIKISLEHKTTLLASCEKALDIRDISFEENRVTLLQYESLRNNFNIMVNDVLGDNYFNMGMDVYDCDRICCEDITRKASRTIWQRIFNT